MNHENNTNETNRTESPVKARLIQYGVSAVIATALLFVVLLVNNYFRLTDPAMKLKVLCDGFTVAGLGMMLAAGLVFVSNAGAFNGLFYGLRTAKEVLLPFLPQQHVRYGDYIEKRKEKRVKGYGFIFFTGLAFFAVAIVLLILFSVRYP